MDLDICRGFRTVATDAVLVLSRTIPKDLLIQETEGREDGTRREIRKARREETLRKWQMKHGNIDCGITQLLTGHGCFGSYLARTTANEDLKWCRACQGQENNPEHVWDVSPRWEQERTQFKLKLGTATEYWSVIKKMLHGRRRWDSIRNAMYAILKKKFRSHNIMALGIY
ncbi:UNVERIFIED_CONTAM: hypothetical protein PYX00_010795 [Menopon gallinae]|uniref:Uncharacterized protein n=1 Tax=Menopon gallinae TaxID=328185 RepID=A0AAW2HHK0_9NEOP